MESPRGRVSIQKKYCCGTCTVLLQDLKFLKKSRVWLKEFSLLLLTFPQVSILLLPSLSLPRSLAPSGVLARDMMMELETCGWKRPGKARPKVEREYTQEGETTRRNATVRRRCIHVKTADVIPAGRVLDEQIPLCRRDYIL